MKYITVVLICLLSVAIAAVQRDKVLGYTTSKPYYPPHYDTDVDCNKLEEQAKNLGFVKLNGHYYFFSKDKKTWNYAQFSCKNKGGGFDLISIESREENKVIANYLSKNHANQVFWTGGTDSGYEGNWVWAHDGTRMNYTNWAKGEPSSNLQIDEDCMVIWNKDQGTWNDAYCYHIFPYICEMQYPQECKKRYANSAQMISGASFIIAITYILSEAAKIL